jgi:nucleoside phosphorylase
MSNPAIYTIGWISVLRTEQIAAQVFLDERHKGPAYLSPNDDNDYILGTISSHNVVIATYPGGECSTASAPSVVRHMLHSFPNIRLALLVGIGGGAPNKKHDIRLGDVVISSADSRGGGVFQNDFGKMTQARDFQTTDFLSRVPIVLRTAAIGLEAQHESHGHQFEKVINNIFEKFPQLRKKYQRPSIHTDRLYQSEFVHPNNDYDSLSCEVLCGDDPSVLVSRPQRTREDDNPVIHYGIVASVNQSMNDALLRDKLAAEINILCFETAAAGLMTNIPYTVIRGICNYSDSHKNKEWQGYAAMTAATYAKDLLGMIPLFRVAINETISSGPSETKASKVWTDSASVILSSARILLAAFTRNSLVTPVGVDRATDKLASIFIEDRYLSPLFTTARKDTRIGPERFTRNFKKLLGIFSADLKEESQNSFDLQLAKLVSMKASSVARRVSALVVLQVTSDDSPKELGDILLASGSRDSRVQQKEYVSGHIVQDALISESLDLSSDGEESGDADGEETRGALKAHFDAIIANLGERVIKESNALKKLRKAFQTFLTAPPNRNVPPERTLERTPGHSSEANRSAASSQRKSENLLWLAQKLNTKVLALLSGFRLGGRSIPLGHQRIWWRNVSAVIVFRLIC